MTLLVGAMRNAAARGHGRVSSVEAPQFRLRMNDVFLGVMALIVLVTVLFGFAHTYFLAGMMRAKLPSVLVHLHGAAFSLWIRLYAQTGLVIARRVRYHRVPGVAGAVLATSMVVLGSLATSALIRRGASPAIWFRNHSPVHKRLMLLATVDILAPAITR